MFALTLATVTLRFQTVALDDQLVVYSDLRRSIPKMDVRATAPPRALLLHIMIVLCRGSSLSVFAPCVACDNVIFESLLPGGGRAL